MNVIKSLWASIQGNPCFMRRINGWLTIVWILMIPVSVVTGWLSSVVYVSALSLWALVSGHWAAWQAARVEVEQQAEVEAEQEHPIEERVAAVLDDRNTASAADANLLSLQTTIERIEAKVDDLHERTLATTSV